MRALPMQVTLQALFTPYNEGNPVVVDTNSYSTVQTLISEYCAKKEIAYDYNFQVLDEFNRVIPLHDSLQSAGITNGQQLFIGYRDEGSNPCSRWPCYVAVTGLVVGVIMIVTLSLLYTIPRGDVPFDHGIVMDAGSTKTEAILYKWQGDKYKGTGCVKQVKDCRVEGGIAKTEDVEGTITKIIKCTANLTVNIKSKRLSTTPLYFTATAGMRLLQKSNKTKADYILSRLAERLNETEMMVKNVSVIGGGEEGMYGWITTNFLKDSLEKEVPAEGPPATYGALDLGGASTQVTFTIPPTDENVNKSVKMTLFGQDHFVYAKSYLCFGRDEAQRRYQALLAGPALIQNSEEYSFNDPCAPKGATLVKNGTYLFLQPCTSTPEFDDLIERNPEIASTNYKFIGTSDYDRCRSVVVELLDKKACDERPFTECFDDLPREIVYQKFVAFAAYYYTTNFLNVTKSNLTEYENVMKNFCGSSIDQIPDEEHKTEYCFNSVYIHEILVSKYGFNETSWKNLEFLKKIDGKSLGWTLGYMINATNVLPTRKPLKLIAPNVFIVCLLVFIIVVVATTIYILHSGRVKKRSAQSFTLKP